MNTSSKRMIASVAAIAVLALGGSAYAQQPAPAPAGDAMKSGTMASEKSKMSTEDHATMKKCKAMTPTAMAADSKCKALMDSHADSMPSGKAKTEKPK